MVAEKLGLKRKPRLTCGLCQFSKDLVVFTGEGAEDPCHHDVVQSSPIDRRISDVGEDVVVQGVTMKREKHEVAPPLVVKRWGFQNDRGHRLYVLDAHSLRVQVRGEGGIEVGVGIDREIVIIVLGDCDPLGNGELYFRWRAMVFSFSQVRAVVRSRARVSSRVLRVVATTMTRASCSRCVVATTTFLLAAVAAATVACCSSTERLEVLFGMVGKMVVVRGGGGRQWWTIGLGQRWVEAKKKLMALITMLEKDVSPKVRWLYFLRVGTYI
jgi:hypothetical protein